MTALGVATDNNYTIVQNLIGKLSQLIVRMNKAAATDPSGLLRYRLLPLLFRCSAVVLSTITLDIVGSAAVVAMRTLPATQSGEVK